jgi:hydroxyacylglutathione hydrolase
MTGNEIQQLADNFFFVQGEGNGRFPSCHGFLLTNRETVLIDAGMGEEKIREIDKEHRIDVLIISHSHPDHIRYWHLLEDRLILMPRETPDSVTDIQLLAERFTDTAEGAEHWAQLAKERFGVRPMRLPDRRFEDGQVLELAGAEIEAVRAPGHLDDHYCFFEHKTGTLLSTDIDFTSFGPWYGNPESDVEIFRQSVEKVMKLPYRRVCSSHKPPVEGDATEKFQAFLDAFDRQKRVVLEMCEKHATFQEMVEASPYFRNGLPDRVVQHVFERAMISKNLALLIRDGLVEETAGHYRRVD